MKQLLSFSAPTGESVLEVLDRAREYCQQNPCDEVVIILQHAKPKTGLHWFGRDEGTVATAIFLAQALIFKLNCALAGIL